MKADEKTLARVVSLRIHPGIGIARLGNSPEGYFVGPEAPGQAIEPADGFKDDEGRVKRQAARFRVYGLDADGKTIAELSADTASIEWSAHLVNKKGAFYEFTSDASKRETTLRNQSVQGDLPPDKRNKLIIDAGPRSVTGRRQASTAFEGGQFQGVPVTLGQLRTDEDGHLLVLGGAGHSDSVEPVAKIKSSYNNTGWFDDTSDGPVSAKVTLPDGRVLDAEPAWVLVAPPNFAPAITNLVSLHERIEETLGLTGGNAEDTPVNYNREVRPLLARLSLYSWVNKDALRGHGPGKPGDFLAPYAQDWLTAKTPDAARRRRGILDRLRVPPSLETIDVGKRKAADTANYYYMPQLAGDAGDPVQGSPDTWMTLLPSQYTALRKWADGDFIIGKPEPIQPFEALPLEERPAALDRAALEPCVGAPLCPGIEMTYISEQAGTFTVLPGDAIRIAPDFGPGDVTRYMALPWQADFHDCFDHWWPAQRPDDVLPKEILDALDVAWGDRKPPAPVADDPMVPQQIAGEEVAEALIYRVPWARGMPETTNAGGAAMVRYWSDLGFVVPKKTRQGERVFVETERAPLVGLDARSLFYKLMNVDNHPECLPEATAYVDHYLEAAQTRQSDPSTPDIWWPFDYSADALQARLMEIYNDLADNAAYYDPATDPICQSREEVIEWLWQWAPFNLTDGAWLRNINRAGPMDEVHALLFTILCDEMGNGNPAQSHANMARDLLHSVGRYPEPIISQAFAMDRSFLDSAFTVPTFALAISQFTERYLPEIIGMTMFLEWCVLDLKPSVELLRYYDIDPHFFVLHIGIDNAADGHGHLAHKAVRVYLDEVRAEGGEPAVQEHWHRIWNGFVAYGTTGSFGQDLANLLKERRQKDKAAMAARAQELIRHKAEFGQLNHGDKKIGANRINDWFRDPRAFLEALVTAGYVVPGEPENSSFLRLLSFENGPMYDVFTDTEIEIWRDWIRSLDDNGRDPVNVSPADAMVLLLGHLRARQTGAEAHKIQTLAAPDGGQHLSITDWFNRPDREFLAALADPENGWIVPGEPGASPFLTERLSDRNPMGQAFDDIVADTGGTERTGYRSRLDYVRLPIAVARTVDHAAPLAFVATLQRQGAKRASDRRYDRDGRCSLRPDRVFDVAIVGAGPAGSSLAIALSARGLRHGPSASPGSQGRHPGCHTRNPGRDCEDSIAIIGNMGRILPDQPTSKHGNNCPMGRSQWCGTTGDFHIFRVRLACCTARVRRIFSHPGKTIGRRAAAV